MQPLERGGKTPVPPSLRSNLVTTASVRTTLHYVSVHDREAAAHILHGRVNRPVVEGAA